MFLPPLQPTWCRAGSVGVRECPAEAGELARDGDRDDRAAFAALNVESLPDAVQPALGLPGDLDDESGLSVPAAAQRLALGGCAALMPCCFDQQPAGVPAAGLGDRALPAFLPAGVLRWGQPEVTHKLPRLLEPHKLAGCKAHVATGGSRSYLCR